MDGSIREPDIPSPGGASPARGLTPPYWLHRQTDSDHRQPSPRVGPITLEDHTEEPSDRSSALWAKGVSIDEHVVVSGNRPRAGAFGYVVYICKVEMLEGGPMIIRKRYSEFDDLRSKLAQTFPDSRAAMPELPPKSAIWRTQPKFLERRKIGLGYFLKYVQQRYLDGPNVFGHAQPPGPRGVDLAPAAVSTGGVAAKRTANSLHRRSSSDANINPDAACYAIHQPVGTRYISIKIPAKAWEQIPTIGISIGIGISPQGSTYYAGDDTPPATEAREHD
ncbi:MAG: PX domain-containing protein ypt35 [Lichina confinis]|nr:MAG: PX domain-containing protein ypt35 [Lichina confinis]